MPGFSSTSAWSIIGTFLPPVNPSATSISSVHDDIPDPRGVYVKFVSISLIPACNCFRQPFPKFAVIHDSGIFMPRNISLL